MGAINQDWVGEAVRGPDGNDPGGRKICDDGGDGGPRASWSGSASGRIISGLVRVGEGMRALALAMVLAMVLALPLAPLAPPWGESDHSMTDDDSSSSLDVDPDRSALHMSNRAPSTWSSVIRAGLVSSPPQANLAKVVYEYSYRTCRTVLVY